MVRDHWGNWFRKISDESDDAAWEEYRENYEQDLAKMARMRLLGEDKIYRWEYNQCEKMVRARERCLSRRAEARRLCSSTKEKASNS